VTDPQEVAKVLAMLEKKYPPQVSLPGPMPKPMKSPSSASRQW
jgi:hypothetical protein